MTNKHSRLKALEKLANEKRVKDRATRCDAESKILRAKVEGMSSEELKAAYQDVQAELSAQPIDPAILTLTTKELIDRYTQLCQEN